LQLVLLQKHHLNDKDCFNSTNGIDFFKGFSFQNLVIPMGSSQRMNVETSILLNRSLTCKIINHSIILHGRIQFDVFQILGFESLVVINVHNANESKDKALMWKIIMNANIEC
jgi:hypothetical protein